MASASDIKIFMTRRLRKVLLGELPLVKELPAQESGGKSCSKWACCDRLAVSQQASQHSKRITKHHCKECRVIQGTEKKRNRELIGTVQLRTEPGS